MDTSLEIFKGRAFHVFRAGEINEVLLAVYRELSIAIRSRSETVILGPSALVHTIHGQITAELPMVYGRTSIYAKARESFLKILERDNLVREFFQTDLIDEDTIRLSVHAPDDLPLADI